MTNETQQLVRVLKIKDANGERTLQFPVQLDLDRPKRARTTFSDEQLRLLEEAFTASGFLRGPERVALAEKLGLTDTQVKVWFQNRRTKHRKSSTTSANSDARCSPCPQTQLQQALLAACSPAFMPQFTTAIRPHSLF